MNDITQILSQIAEGDPRAAEQLVPLVYHELRKLAAAKLAHEKPGQTLQATALVHDAYIRLVDAPNAQHWDSRGHFFAAVAEAMRRILIENTRRKKSLKFGGDLDRVQLVSDLLVSDPNADNLLAIDEALDRLALEDAQAAELVKLRFFAEFSITEAPEVLGISRSTAYEQWTYAKAWLLEAIA